MESIQIITPYNMSAIESGSNFSVVIKINSLPKITWGDISSLTVGCEYINDNINTLLSVSGFSKITSDGTFLSQNNAFTTATAKGTYKFNVKDVGDSGIKRFRVFVSNGVSKVYSNEIFLSSLTTLSMTYKAIETDRIIRKIKVDLEKNIIKNSSSTDTSDVSLKLYATNNPFDANPVWVEVKEGEFTELPNENISDKTGVQLKISGTKTDSTVSMVISNIIMTYY